MSAVQRALGLFLGSSTEEFMDIVIENRESTLQVYPRIYPEMPEVSVAEQEQSIAIVIKSYERFDTAIAQAVLEEADWNVELALKLASQIVDDTAICEMVSSFESGKLEECDDPSFPILCHEFPELSKKLIAYGLRRASFRLDDARTSLQRPAMRKLIEDEMNAILQDMHKSQVQNTPSIKKLELKEPTKQREIHITTQSWTVPSTEKKLAEHLWYNKQKPTASTLTVDLHSHTVEEAVVKVRTVLDNLAPHITKVNFITGKGLHSKNNIPLIRPKILFLTKEWGYKRELMPTNSGVISVYI